MEGFSFPEDPTPRHNQGLLGPSNTEGKSVFLTLLSFLTPLLTRLCRSPSEVPSSGQSVPEWSWLVSQPLMWAAPLT